MKRRMYSVIVTIIILLLVGEISVLAYFSHESWYNRIGFVLQVIGFYAIGIGFIQKSDLLKNFVGIDDMTSPDPARFLRGNILFLAVLSSLVSVGFSENRSRKSSMAFGCFGQLLLLCSFPFLLIYFLVHLILICPFAYVGYLFTSALLESISGSSDDIEWTSASAEQSQKMRIKEIIASNPSASKSFLIGIPAVLLALITKGIQIFSH